MVETIIALTRLILLLNILLKMMNTPTLIPANIKGVKHEMKILKINSLSANMFIFVS